MIGATGRSTGGKRAGSAPGAPTTTQNAAAQAATTTRAGRIHFPRRPASTTYLGASRAPRVARSSTRVLSLSRRQQHRDDCHAVDDVAIQYHPEHRVERKGANVDELRFVGGRLRVVEAVGQEQVRRLVDHALARVDRKSTRLNSSHLGIWYAVFCF